MESDNRLGGRKKLITITVRDCDGKCGDKGESERATYAMIGEYSYNSGEWPIF
jgi:hypothetical protein